MSTIRSIGVENFKLLKDKTEFNLAPITVLTGTNSSGKSSVIQAVRLLTSVGQHIPSYASETNDFFNSKPDEKNLHDIFFDLDLNILGDRLGDFSKIISRNSDNDTITLSIGYDTPVFGTLDLSLIYQLKGKLKYGKMIGLTISTKECDDPIMEYTVIKNEDGTFGNTVTAHSNLEILWNQYRDYIDQTRTKWNLLQHMNNTFIEKYGGNFKNFKENNREVSEIFIQLKRLEPSLLGYYPSYNKEEWDTIEPINVVGDDQRFNGIVLKSSSKKDPDWSWIENISKSDTTLYDYWNSMSQKEGAFENIQDLLKLNGSSIEKLEEINAAFETLVHTYLIDFWTMCKGWSVVKSFLTEFSIQNYLKDPLKYFIDHGGYSDAFMSYPKSLPMIDTPEKNLFHSVLSAEQKRETDNFVKKYLTKLDRYGKNDLIRVPDNLKLTSLGESYLEELSKSVLTMPHLVIKQLSSSVFLSSFRTKSARIQKMMDGSDLGSIVHQILAEDVLNNPVALIFLEKYLRSFKIADEVIIKKDDEGYQFKLFVRLGKEEFLLADVGYGYSQLMPIILTIAQLATREKGYKETYDPISLIIEEPEANLHPALQSKLADMFYEAYKEFNIQFIVETHSEYLIRRLQVMTADPKCEMQPADTQIHYFYHPDEIPEGEKQVYPINIQKDGALSKNFGKGFFDESSNLNIALYGYTTDKYN